jgi:hypothetical protein
MRSLAGRHLTLYTDLPAAGEVDSLTAAFDQAVPQWCRYFEVPPERASGWHLTGYLIHDRSRAAAAGVLPADLPPFLHGYQKDHELWLYDQPSDYYRRHLLLHEGTHAFAAHFLGAVGPPWYAEGMAELLATHRWNAGQLTLRHFPTSKDQVSHWGRIKLIQQQLTMRRVMTIDQITQYAGQPSGLPTTVSGLGAARQRAGRAVQADL